MMSRPPPSPESGTRFIVVGAGLAGSLMACYLGRAGHDVRVLEKRPDPRADGFLGGRSINLALSTRGIAALREVGLADAVLADAVPMRGRLMHGADGALSFQRYGTQVDQVIHSISREGLNVRLIEEASKQSSVELSFGARCTDVDPESPSVFVEHADGRSEAITADAVIGADGAYSAVRARMQRLDRFDYRQDFLSHGYKELTIPPSADGSFRMEKNALHIWPRGGFMMIALPNQDASYTCTLFWPFEGRNSFASVRTETEIESFFDQHFPDAVPHMPALVRDYQANPTSSLVTLRCAPWNVGPVLLIGDAAHAVVPFYGQGMNASFEDCALLNRTLEANAGDVRAAFNEFAISRKPDTDALADLAIKNFVEMRDRVASPAFLMRKALGRAAHRIFPRWFVPIYSMVTFSTIPYARAVARERRQNRGIAVIVAVLVVALLSTLLFL